MVLKCILAAIIGYLLGNIPSGVLISKAYGIHDIRKHGSGNSGTTNVLRTLGWLPSVLTLVGDCLKGYVACLVQDTNQMNDVLPVKDPAVGSLIHNYRLLAQQSGHVLLLDIRDDLSGVVTGAYETNKIIGNLLQNALDELSGQEGTGWMELSIFKRGGNCLIRVSNPTRVPEEFDRYKEAMFRQGFSTKHGHDGVGLSSIRALAQQHGGDVTAWREGNTVHFVASIPMQLL